MAKALAHAGAEIAIWGTDSDKNARATSVIEKLSEGRVFAATCDISDEAEVEHAFLSTVEALGKVDIVFANAGAGGNSSLPWEMSFEEWRRVQAINLDGVFLTLRAAASYLVERGEGGALVVTSSTSAIHGAPRNASYASAKTGALGLMRAYSVALARHKVRVNALLPGWTDTDMLSTRKRNERFVEGTTSRTPVRRWANPDEYGPAAVFLANPDNTFHTGDSLVVDGGYTIF